MFCAWSNYEGMDHGERFKMKRIFVDSVGSLSYCKHHHHAGHWVVVCVAAKATSGEDGFLVTWNKSAYILLGTVQRLENPGHLPWSSRKSSSVTIWVEMTSYDTKTDRAVERLPATAPNYGS